MSGKTSRILLLGSGGREHALAWKITQSPLCEKLWIAPGNGGTGRQGKNVQLDIADFAKVGAFCLENRVDILVVGPEAPLVAGIVDYFNEDPSLSQVRCIGPSRLGAMLEGSKDFAKQFMLRHGIPTATYRSFSNEETREGLAYIEQHPLPIVLKADGLAAGKGVVICQTHQEAKEEFRLMHGGKFGAAGSQVVIEQFLSGIEFSVFVLTDGKHAFLLPEAKDYKRIGEGDSGLNTGGMGSVSPVPFVDAALMRKVHERIIVPTIRGIASEGIHYQGFIFFGLILVDGDPFVIEYNCRLGDPETESILPRLRNDLVELFHALHHGTLDAHVLDIDPRFATTIVCASGGYPGNYATGIQITLPHQTSSMIFHAGTREHEDSLVTSGGRVFAVTSLGDTMQAALKQSNETAEAISYDGKYFRRDIGFDLTSAS